MLNKTAFALLVMTLGLSACGDDDRIDNPNNIILVDSGTDDAGGDGDQETDAELDTDQDANDSPPDLRVVSISITPDRPYVSIQQSTRLVATLSIDGEVDSEALFEWESETPLIASVDQTGYVTAISAGEAAIVARVGEHSRRAFVNVFSTHQAIATGRAHTCSSKTDGRITCWGANDYMQAGNPAEADAPTAQEVLIPSGDFIQKVYVGVDHSCGVTTTGDAMCWGNNRSDQLSPLATESEHAVPIQVAFGSPIKKMALGRGFTCALLENSSLRCWGDNSDKVINESSNSTVADPANTHPTRLFRDIAAGDSHVCALANDFNLYCWGDHSANQLGENAAGNGGHGLVKIGTTQYTSVSAYGDQTCAFSLFKGLQCWGSSAGGFGEIDLVSTPTPTTIDLADPNFQRMSVGGDHICAVVADATYCWGKNDRGQLGDGSTVDRALPAPVMGSPAFDHLACGEQHCCGIGIRGSVYCWGDNSSGQLGDGSGAPQRLPVLAPPTAF